MLSRLCGCLALLLWLPAAAEELNVAVAANFLGTLQALAPRFEQSTGNHLQITSASSGQLYAQIVQDAPFDVFLSADSDRPQKLEAEGLVVPGSRFTYAIGTLVLWSPRAGVVDADGRLLRSTELHLLAIAEPKNAPYGAAAQQVLTAMGLWDSLNREHRIAVAQDINQAWQFAASGNADAAFVAKSQVSGASPLKSGDAGSLWAPPQSQYNEITQDGVILAHSSKQPTAQAFMHWLRTDRQAIGIIRAAGYRVRE
jgi:molybdate transport system substrate-binding protein